jgi:hypothetical protein
MNGRQALAYVRKHGVVLMAARGPVPSLAEAIAGAKFRGSWWAHPESRRMFRIFETVRASPQVLTCRLVGGKVTFVHRRLWPALARLASRWPKSGLAAIHEEHTAEGRHRTRVTPYPRWLPEEIAKKARGLRESEAVDRLGSDLLGAIGEGGPVRGKHAR